VKKKNKLDSALATLMEKNRNDIKEWLRDRAKKGLETDMELVELMDNENDTTTGDEFEPTSEGVDTAGESFPEFDDDPTPKKKKKGKKTKIREAVKAKREHGDRKGETKVGLS
jgi:hypothetical protein